MQAVGAVKVASKAEREPLETTDTTEVVEPDALEREEEADAEAEAEAETGPQKVVRYNGFSFEERSITRADWARVGVDHDTVTWDKSNDWRVPASDLDFLNEAQFTAYITSDTKFVVEEV